MSKIADCSTEGNELEAGGRRIRELREARAKLTNEVPRLTALVGAADGHSGEIESLQRARTEAQAVALIDVHEPDTAAIDERIIEAERAAAKALEYGATARAALNVIAQRCAALDAELKQAVETQLEAAARDLIAQREATYAEYNIAVDGLRAPLERMLALERTLDVVRDRQAHMHGNPRRGGGIGPAHNLVDALRGEGLRMLREHDHAIWPCAWLSRPQITAVSPAFSQRYLGDAVLD